MAVNRNRDILVIAATLALTAAGMTLAQRLLGLRAPLFLYSFAVVVTAQRVGFIAGIITTFISAVLIFVGSSGTAIVTSRRIPLFIFVGFAISFVSHRLRRSRERVVESEERYRLLVDGISDYAISSLDLDGRVTSWNVGAERIKGYRTEEV